MDSGQVMTPLMSGFEMQVITMWWLPCGVDDNGVDGHGSSDGHGSDDTGDDCSSDIWRLRWWQWVMLLYSADDGGGELL